MCCACVCVCVCARQYYSFLTRKYNVCDGERITTLFSYRGNNTNRNQITCDAVGMMLRRAHVVLRSTVFEEGRTIKFMVYTVRLMRNCFPSVVLCR